MLFAILGGQPVCSATQPSQTVAHVREKHMTANQSSELTTPRRKVGRAKDASTALGTASRLYSGSKTSARNSMSTSGARANISGTQIWGAFIQARQRHNASRANGQVGHRNQGRSRSRLSTLRQLSPPMLSVCHSHHCWVQ